MFSESPQITGVLLENVPDRMSRDVLSMLVENTLGLDESNYSLEIIWESSTAVVTFSKPEGRKQVTVTKTGHISVSYPETLQHLKLGGARG